MMRLIKKILIGAILLSFTALTYVNGFGGVFQQGNQGSLNNPKELNIFYPAFIKYSGEMEKYIDGCDTISFAWSRLYKDELSKLGTVKGAHDNYGFYYPDDYLKPVLYARSKGKTIQLSVYADGACANSVLPSKEKRQQAINTIISTVNKDITPGQSVFYDGVVIDFESLRDIDKNGSDILYNGEHISYYFNLFLSELNVQLDKYGKRLYVAVNPRLYFNGYDYGSIVKIADKMIIMAHDYGPTGKLKKSDVKQYLGCDALTPIDSPAPISKIKMALEDAKNSIPDPLDLKKVMLQICFDCKQWWFSASTMEDWEALDSSSLSSKGVSTVFYNKIKDRIDNKDGKGSYITRVYNNELQCPVIQYLNSSGKTFNIIDYEDKSSISAKLKMAQSYGLGGISIWSLGNIPDYNDANGKKFQLDVWNSLASEMNAFGKEAQNNAGTAIFTDPAVENAVKTKLGIQGDIGKDDLEEVYRLKLPSGTVSLEDLKMLPNLEYLDAQGLKLTDIKALSGLTKLRVLKLQNNKLRDISALAGLKKLQILNLTSNAVTDVSPLGGLNSLEELYAGSNLITNVSALKNANGLKTLYMDFNKISDITCFAALKNLYRLSMEGNSISQVTALTGLNKLRYLNLASNKIADISALKTVKKLNFLYLQRNSIKDITALKEMAALKELSLNGNKILNVKALSGLKSLEKLYLKENSLTGVGDLKDLKKLNTLYLGGNNIKDFSPLKAYYNNLKYCDFKIK